MNKVFFTNDLSKTAELFEIAGLKEIIQQDDSIALKIHFGEPGNTAYLKPHQVKLIAEKIISYGGRPFYTDCNTLYQGRRMFSKDHLLTAEEHGFTLEQAGAKAFIPEEEDSLEIDVSLKHFKKVYIGSNAGNKIFALTHFKGHDVTGFGGAIKNLGMGFGTRKGKLKMHQDCINCKEVKTCKRNQTLEACYFGSSALVQEKMAEYAYGAVKNKQCAYFNFLINISPNCDCYPFNGPPIMPDVGVFASFDPVAIDQACLDKADKIKSIYPNIDCTIQLNYAEKIGLGSRKYQIINL